MSKYNKTLIPDSPSPLEEDFEYAFSEVLITYKGEFINKGYTKEQFAEWCCELVNKYI